MHPPAHMTGLNKYPYKTRILCFGDGVPAEHLSRTQQLKELERLSFLGHHDGGQNACAYKCADSDDSDGARPCTAATAAAAAARRCLRRHQTADSDPESGAESEVRLDRPGVHLDGRRAAAALPSPEPRLPAASGAARGYQYAAAEFPHAHRRPDRGLWRSGLGVQVHVKLSARTRRIMTGRRRGRTAPLRSHDDDAAGGPGPAARETEPRSHESP
jgi:hypothetical protein